ncbi:PD40 domain-containing protein [Pseudoalteromonas ruthenica]|uniref:PD40 domain-containing protein n=1 Tax=Pseudoalteromonas ruthenica TaxID=151081 RepID=UPI001244F71D|nr:PD40 domain-containing protein [Pseudoalteromonas ruthenica]
MTTINSILSVMLLGGSALSAQAEVLSVEKLTQLNKVHSVAVSSDGRQLVYGVKTPEGSDLYLQPLSAVSSSYAGSANLAKATRLTYDSSSETAVRFSSDGQAIYFLSSLGLQSAVATAP